MPFALTKEQAQAVSHRGGPLLVSAAAGSGKTRVLVERLLSRIEEGADIDRFLVITYTRAAAAELRARVVSELSDRLAARPGDAFLRRQSTLVYQAQISTVHAFCANLLREEGHRLDLDRDQRLCDENESRLLQEEALNTVLEKRYEDLDPVGDFVQLVDTMSAGRDDSRLMQIVLDVRSKIQSHPDPARWLDEQEAVFALEGVADAGETPWGQLLLADVRRQADYWAGRMLEGVDLCQGDAVLEKAYAPALQGAMNSLLALSAATQEGWDKAKEKADFAFPRLGSSRNNSDPAAVERIKAFWKTCKDRMKKLQKLFIDDSGGLLADMRSVYPAIRGLFALVRDFEAEYAAAKRRRGVLDFSDLEHMAAQLLIGPDGAPTELALRWGERYDEVMVDEYQDTNAVQNAIFSALTAKRGDLFMVGDVKQSIYRFRLADPTIFLEKYRDYKPFDEAQAGEPCRVLLSQNFRSRPQVLEAVNDLFRAVMSVPFGEMEYTDAEALVPGRNFPVDGDDGYAMELDVLDCSGARDEDDENAAAPGDDAAGEEDGAEAVDGPKPPANLLEARFVARRIRELLDSGFPIPDGDGGTRPVRAEDVVVLLRSPGPVLRHYAAALGELDVPWQAEGGEDFFASTEIQVALSILRIIDNPRQDVPLIAALRSAVYAFSADRLAQIRANSPNVDFYTALTQDGGADTAAFLSELDDLRRHAGDESCERLVWRVFDCTDLLGVFASMDEGEKRRGNLLLLAQLAGEFERDRHRGLFGFLTYLRRLEESGRDVIGPQTGEISGGVRIMSIHRSKGLEFPVVFLAGLSRKFNKTDSTKPMLFHAQLGVGPKRLDLDRMLEYPTLARLAVAKKMDQELSAEELRLLYVAMTRAREKLILVCGLSGGRKELGKLAPAAGCPVEPQALLDCDRPGRWVLLSALARREAKPLLDGAFPPPVRPGTEFGPAWDIRWVDASVYAEAPARRRTAAAEVSETGEEAEGLAACFQWSYPHAADVELPSKLTATQLKGRDLDEEAAQEAPKPLAAPNFHRPRFAAEKLGLTPTQKGTALHLVMQYIDFAACQSVESVAGEIVRLVEKKFITPQQAEAVEPEKVFGFFDSDLGREALASQSLRREFKFSVLVPATRYFPQAGEGETVLLQGVVDCYFEDAGGVTVIDFKTDHVYGDKLLERAEEYRPQLTAYAQALGEITGKPVKRRVLWFFSEGRAVEV